ncbi:hypothetical protein BDV98DRAFT_569625 [Pterulicium gracile]|uniref:Uncharacterized protein n=1 Tax=Pterulicium gracile TaxID=1884261 RepID=A0A5C3QGG2_9AGAR|nr:hypothetical protein BDV98DRAFT_569625 [Pterula gracilis]
MRDFAGGARREKGRSQCIKAAPHRARIFTEHPRFSPSLLSSAVYLPTLAPLFTNSNFITLNLPPSLTPTNHPQHLQCISPSCNPLSLSPFSLPL